MDEDLADPDSDDDKPMKATRGRRKSSLRSTTVALRGREAEKTKPVPKDPKSRRTKSGSSVDPGESKSGSTLRKSSTMDTHKSTTSRESTKLKSDVSATSSSKQVHSRKGSIGTKRQLSPATLQVPKGRVKRQKESEPLVPPPGEDKDARATRRSNMQKPQFFESLSTRERANKARDRAPPASEAELFRPDEIIKRMSNTGISASGPKSGLKKPLSRTSSISHSGQTGKASMDMDIDTDVGGMEPPPPPTSKRPLPTLKLPDFKKLKLSNNREGPQSAQPSPSAPMMSPAMMSPGTVMSGSPAATTPKIRSVFETQSPKITTTILATDDSTFETRVTFSDSRVDIGMARFEGFSSGFVTLLYQHFRENTTLHISRSLETAYIVKYFVPEMGPPLEHAEMFVDLNLCDPFRSSLTLFHGAGVLIHPQFTLLIFLSTNDILRKAFNLLQSNKKGPLRAVAYPPLEPELFTSNTGAPPLDDGFRHYHPNLYSRTMGLDLASYNTSVLSPSTVRACVIYSPPLATLEQTELTTLLKIHGVKYVLPYTDIPEFLHHSKRPETRILVHASFRDKLHLLPHVRELLKVSIGIPQFQWHFFGLSVEMARYPNLKPIHDGSFGRIEVGGYIPDQEDPFDLDMHPPLVGRAC
ncbi:hypothetical protein EX30DRAFT_9743 [Ascodesmis nigricans]|uniref:Uncharacterized protein n=1 Tax=Ascodesmis nigricans TaxID=341454 RepID=A0A4S2N6C4_9PEZI|nr:hypothetical protein EX30DRAFT_9743 [Ascodesmis nigricans]